MEVKIEKASGVKCPRCWNYTPSCNYDNLCNRCVAVILEGFPNHPSHAKILENLELRGLTPEQNPYYDKPHVIDSTTEPVI